MEQNLEMGKQMIEAVRAQIKNNEPPETKNTYFRLLAMGISETEILKMIAQCLIFEIYAVVKSEKPFDKDRYAKSLNQLPKLPE